MSSNFHDSAGAVFTPSFFAYLAITFLKFHFILVHEVDYDNIPIILKWPENTIRLSS